MFLHCFRCAWQSAVRNMGEQLPTTIATTSSWMFWHLARQQKAEREIWMGPGMNWKAPQYKRLNAEVKNALIIKTLHLQSLLAAGIDPFEHWFEQLVLDEERRKSFLSKQ